MNKARLSDVVEIISGGTPKTSTPEYWNGDIPWLSVVDFGDKNKFVYDTEKKITQSGVEHSSTTVLNKDDIIMSARGTVGAMAMLKRPMAFNQSCFGLRAKSDLMDQNYLFYFLKNYMHNIQAKSQGSVFSTINLATFDNLTIQYPDLSTQRKIAKILSTIDDEIETNLAISSQLESLAKTIYDYWFLQFDFPDENGRPYKSSGGKMVWNEELKREIPEGWKISTIGQETNANRGVSYTGKNLSDKGTYMLTLGCANKDGSFNSDGIKCYIGDYKKGKELKPYDLIVYNTDMTSGKFIVGRAILVPQIFDGPVISSHHLTTIHCKNDSLKWFFYYLINTNSFHDYIKGFASGTNVIGLDYSGVETFATEIPPINILNKFAKIALNIADMRSQIMRENQQLSSLRDFLLPMLMNGQVTFKEEA